MKFAECLEQGLLVLMTGNLLECFRQSDGIADGPKKLGGKFVIIAHNLFST